MKCRLSKDCPNEAVFGTKGCEKCLVESSRAVDEMYAEQERRGPEPLSPEEIQANEEASAAYFDRYVAGDR